jgi:hypothetical protein
MSPVPGQAHTETNSTLLAAEGSSATYPNRKSVYGLLTQKYERSGVSVPIPIWLAGSERSETVGLVTRTWQSLDLVASGDSSGPDSDVAAPLLDSPLGTLDNELQNWRLADIEARTIDGSTKALRFAQLSVGLGDYVAPYLLGKSKAGEAASVPSPIDFSRYGFDHFMSKNKASNIQIDTIFTDTAKLYFGKSFIYDANTSVWTSPTNENDGNSHLNPGTANRTTSRLTTPAYTTGEYALQYSNDWKVSQSHAVIAVATGAKALCAVIRNELSEQKLPFQYFDPSANTLKSTRTLNESGTSYTEDGIEVATGWAYWPTFVSTVPTANESGASFDGAIHVRLGGADSGLLRSDLTYEVGYSLFDITTGHETNVCEPARIRTSADDYVSFTLFRNVRTGGINQQECGYTLNLPVQKVPIEKVNYYEYRFYYRALGSQEWLPAGNISAANLLFNGQNDVLWFAENPAGLSIGGAPGQFNDYSTLPVDNWKDVAVFQNRFFWVSDKQAIFSLANNAFAYPVRNCISIPSGEFRGITVHVFYGQSQQSGRVVFWASDAQYEGRFTGQFALYPVSVSPDYTAQFPLDGSDFSIQFRSSITAFSSRSAVVAEGTLFFWGESGIYADSGVQPPNKISGPIEPWLGGVYDPTQIANIHCIYNDKTKEIIWFYTPKVATSFITEALVFNAEKQSFSRFGFATQIDWCQAVNLSQQGSRKRLACGKRMLMGHSATSYPQRAVFFDESNQTGDLKHGKEFMVKEIQATANGSRLILASGFDIPSFADIAVGESFLVSQSFEYTESENAYNNRYVIADIGAYYFDIDEGLTPAVFTNDKLMPIWLDKYSNIPFKIRTRFITPGSRWETFMISFLAMSIRLPYSILQDFTIGLFSNFNSDPTTQTVSLQRNAVDHCIRQLSFPHDDEKTHGIGFGFEASGNVNGAGWRLDWIGINAQACETLGRFEQE